MEKIKGYINHFIYQREDNGYAVMEVMVDGKPETCVGYVQGYSEGEMVELEGEYVVHPIYKKQLKIQSIKAIPPEDKVAIERYLGSGAIKGIGAALASRIVAKFGEDTFRIAQEEPERLSEVKGISARKAIEISSQLAEKRDLRDAMIFLQKYGITQNLANKIYQKYGTGLYQVVEENPYKLAEDIEGVGFKIADEIATKSGIAVDSDYRVRCGIHHVLLQTTYEGHCYYPKDLLLQKTAELLGLETSYMDNQLQALVMDKKVVIRNTETEERVYAGSYYYEEVKCAAKLLELQLAYDHPISEYSDERILKLLSGICSEMEMELDKLQEKAVIESVKNGVFILSGGPGTGKTTTINAIIRFLTEEGLDIMLAAPTGRAAKRMSEATGYEAKTIHRLLEINGDVEQERRAFFSRDEENPLEVDAIIIDEMSMVDIHLMRALLAATQPGTKLILVGDVDQLHSVGPGQVLRDVIDSKCFPCVMLEKIFRQAAESHIVSYAHNINHGEKIDFTEKYRDFFLLEKNDPEVIYHYIEQLMKVNVPKEFKIDPLEIQVLTPMKKGVLGVENLNRVLQERLNPADEKKAEHEYGDVIYREGDKVMQIRNDYNLEWEIVGKYNIPIDSGNGVFNGDVGKITEINEYFKTLTILFDDGRKVIYPFSALDEIDHAYAITIHKAQGSEYPAIIMPLLGGPKVLLNRNLLYTGVTRAKDCVIILGSGATVNEMIATDMVQKRYTSLKEKIIDLYYRD